MRPVVFHLADKAMADGFRAFFKRNNWHYALGCARFDINHESDEDIFQIPGCTDPGIWQNAHNNLTTHFKSHERAVIVLDEYFGVRFKAAIIAKDITRNMLKSGWERERFEVIVITPMLEAWLWADNINVVRAFGFHNFNELQRPLIDRGLWVEGEFKPAPAYLKEAKEVALKLGNTKMGSAVFRRLFEKLSSRAIDACQEPGFQLMRARLREWFPPKGGKA